jgi:hypothetical protein
MKPRVWVLGTTSFAAALTSIAFFTRPLGPPLTLSLVSYSHDVRELWHYQNATNGVVGILAVTNRTSHIWQCMHGSVQVRTQKGWIDDEGWTSAGREEMSTQLCPGKRMVFSFPAPAGTNNWRCSIQAFDETSSLHGWRNWFVERLRKIGVRSKELHTIWSLELVR